MKQRCALISAALLLACLGAQGQNQAKPQRKVKGLPRYMTDIPQPIPDELKLLVAPKTVRDVNCYTSFATSSGMQDVVRKCGIPDEHQGSGIYIFLYDMSDGSVVAVGTADLKHLMYVNHIQRRGSRSLLQESVRHHAPGGVCRMPKNRCARQTRSDTYHPRMQRHFGNDLPHSTQTWLNTA